MNDKIFSVPLKLALKKHKALIRTLINSVTPGIYSKNGLREEIE
jgi:hypothetical protein